MHILNPFPHGHELDVARRSLSATALALLRRIDEEQLGEVPASREVQELHSGRFVAGMFSTSPRTGETIYIVEGITLHGIATIDPWPPA